MTEQPEALRLAESLEITNGLLAKKEAAAELRRLHAEVDRLSYRLAYPDNFVSPEVEELRAINAQLLEALEFVMSATGEQLSTAFENAQDAIIRARGQE